MPDEPVFTAEDALATTASLRRALGLEPELFPVQAFIGMISDEIEQCRERGQDDAAIAALVSKVTGKAVTADLIARFYAPPEERGFHESEEP